MVLTYPDKSLSVNSDHPKKRTIWSRSEIAQGEHFSFKMFATKFCSLGQSFISIAQVNLESYEKSCPQGVFTPKIFLTDIYIYIYQIFWHLKMSNISSWTIQTLFFCAHVHSTSPNYSTSCKSFFKKGINELDAIHSGIFGGP